MTPIVEPNDAQILMVGHLRRHCEMLVVAQVLHDPGGPEGTAANLVGHTDGLGPPTDHPVDVGLAYKPLCKLTRASIGLNETSHPFLSPCKASCCR